METLLRYIANATDKIDEEDIKKAIKQIEKGGDIMPTLAEKWIEQGRMEGMILEAQEMVL